MVAKIVDNFLHSPVRKMAEILKNKHLQILNLILNFQILIRHKIELN